MRLIDADALGVGEAAPNAFKERAYALGWNTAIKIIQKAPTVDAVPVVRCKECRYYTSHVCCHPGGMKYTSGCDYCSLGVRPGDEQEG